MLKRVQHDVEGQKLSAFAPCSPQASAKTLAPLPTTPHLLFVRAIKVLHVPVTAEMAKRQIAHLPIAAFGQWLQMLDGRSFADIGGAAKTHFALTKPAIIAVSFTQSCHLAHLFLAGKEPLLAGHKHPVCFGGHADLQTHSC